MYDIDFLKWKCEVAGLKTTKNELENTVFKICNSTFVLEHLSKESLVYSLLLQKAIEGINKKIFRFHLAIDQCSLRIRIFQRPVFDFIEQFDITKDGVTWNPDEAKDATLYYVYEQEKRNESNPKEIKNQI